MENAEKPDKPANSQVVYSWKAPMRAYKKRSKNVIRFYIALTLIISTLIVFFGDLVLLIPIWSVLFLFYVLTVTPPPEVETKITQFGIDTAGVVLRWEMLSHFYFIKRFDMEMLTVVTHAPYLLHAYVVIPDEEVKKHIVEILSAHIMYDEHPRKSWTDRMIDWLSVLVPDDHEDTEVKEVIPEKSGRPASFYQKFEETSL